VLLAAHCLKNKNGETKKTEIVEAFGGPDSKKRLSAKRQVTLHPQYTNRNATAFDGIPHLDTIDLKSSI
jgi:hypothetical protein